MSTQTSVLLISDSPARIRRWLGILTTDAVRPFRGVAEVPPRHVPDVIVADRPVSGRDFRRGALQARWAAREIGVVAIGGRAAGDVVLAERFTPAELRLACSLLAENVRLRRERNRARRLQQALQRMARSDPLTGLPNRRAWEDELVARAATASRYGVAILDLDHFKAVNEWYGYLAGDDVLRHVARRLAARARGAFVARLGGDEFGILSAGEAPRDWAARVERLRRAVCDRCPCTSITASGGVACHDPVLATTPEAVFSVADGQLRRAKASGRDQTCVALSES